MKLHIYSHQSDAAPWSPWVAMCGRLIGAHVAEADRACGLKPDNVCAACWRVTLDDEPVSWWLERYDEVKQHVADMLARRRADEAGRSYAERVERVYRRLSR